MSDSEQTTGGASSGSSSSSSTGANRNNSIFRASLGLNQTDNDAQRQNPNNEQTGQQTPAQSQQPQTVRDQNITIPPHLAAILNGLPAARVQEAMDQMKIASAKADVLQNIEELPAKERMKKYKELIFETQQNIIVLETQQNIIIDNPEGDADNIVTQLKLKRLAKDIDNLNQEIKGYKQCLNSTKAYMEKEKLQDRNSTLRVDKLKQRDMSNVLKFNQGLVYLTEFFNDNSTPPEGMITVAKAFVRLCKLGHLCADTIPGLKREDALVGQDDVLAYLRERYMHNQMNYVHMELFNIVHQALSPIPRNHHKHFDSLTRRLISLRTHAVVEIEDRTLSEEVFTSSLLIASNSVAHFTEKWLEDKTSINNFTFHDLKEICIQRAELADKDHNSNKRNAGQLQSQDFPEFHPPAQRNPTQLGRRNGRQQQNRQPQQVQQQQQQAQVFPAQQHTGQSSATQTIQPSNFDSANRPPPTALATTNQYCSPKRNGCGKQPGTTYHSRTCPLLTLDPAAKAQTEAHWDAIAATATRPTVKLENPPSSSANN